MKKKWAITIIVPILFGIAYYATYEIAWQKGFLMLYYVHIPF